MSKPKIRTAILVDLMGSDFGATTPEMEIEQHVNHFSDLLAPAKLDWYQIYEFDKSVLKDGTDLVLFDYGGMTLGNSLMEDNSRRLVQWAADHPTSLVVVVSGFTYRNTIEGEMQELGLGPLANVVNGQSGISAEDDPIPSWFRVFKRIPKKPYATSASKRSAIAGLARLGGTLPDMKFFKPRPEFIHWMKRYESRPAVYDVGAGCGHVAKALAEAGLSMVAIDASHRESEEFKIKIADATTFPYRKGSVVMLARPCHGLFAQAVIERAISRGAAAVLYVGKPANLRNDLSDYWRDFIRQDLEKVGSAGERIYLWQDFL